MTITHDIGSILLVTCAVMAIVFCILYHLSSFWWRSEEGKHLMSFTGSIAAILTMYTIKIISGTHAPWFEVLRLIIFVTFPAVLGWRLSMLFRFQIIPRGKWRRNTWRKSSSLRIRMNQYLRQRAKEQPTRADRDR